MNIRSMHSIVNTGRLLSRALWNGISNYTNNPETTVSRKREPRIVHAVCGFPKEVTEKRLKKGQFGDDAWFHARNQTSEVLGVADGVGGWRNYGIDPGKFSLFLMKTCERLVESGLFQDGQPKTLLAKSYFELLESKQPIVGSSTACVVVLNRKSCRVFTANIGDSGFVVVRHGEVIHQSEEQQHYFNTPFQLAAPPPGQSDHVLSDSPYSADTSSFPVEDGDVILLATDGVFDNIPQQLLVTEMTKVQGERDPGKIQGVANNIAWMAKSLAFDSTFMSPFAESARHNGIEACGGKPDDITVLLATVAL